MFMERKLSRSLVIVTTLAVYACLTQIAAARGGGHGGGGHHGGGHHAGGHHGGHNHHPYHPSHHHASHHHASHHHDGHHNGHHDHHHYAHHHHGWHHGGWGPGFWGGAAVGYGLGYGYGNWGGYGYGGDGDTYVDNSTNVTPVSDESDAGDSDDASSDDAADDQGDEQSANANAAGDQGFPTDDWPELGVVTYAGQYGGSQGQVIVRVVPGSAAEKAGLVPGDVILTFNGKPVPSADDLDSAMDSAGGKFEVNVWDARTGRKSAISGTLDPNAAPPATETASAPVQQ